MNNYSFKLYLSPSSSEELKRYWRDIEESKQELKFFQTYQWNQTLFTHLFDESNIFCVVVFLSNNPIAIFPFQLSSFKFIINIPILQFPTHSHIKLSDCVCDESEYPRLLTELINFLDKSSILRWTFINFQSLPKDADLARLLKCSNHSLMYYFSAAKSSSYFFCQESYKESTIHMTSKFLKNIRRLQNKAGREGKIRYTYTIQKTGNMDDDFQQFLSIEADGWKGEEGTAIKCNTQLVRFYKQLSEIKAEKLNAVINTLYINDIPIATQLGLKLNDQLNLLKIGFSEQYKHLGPGNIILAKTIDHCIEKNTQHINFVTQPPWAEKWKTGAEENVNITIFKDSYFSKFIYYCYQTNKTVKVYLAQKPSNISQKLVSWIKNVKTPLQTINSK